MGFILRGALAEIEGAIGGLILGLIVGYYIGNRWEKRK
jgi:membrane associated rhomboid family serine protease